MFAFLSLTQYSKIKCDAIQYKAIKCHAIPDAMQDQMQYNTRCNAITDTWHQQSHSPIYFFTVHHNICTFMIVLNDSARVH